MKSKLLVDIEAEKTWAIVHAHAALAKRGGITVGGHFIEGHVRPTLEVMLSRAPAYLERKFDAASGIALIQI